MFAHPFAWLLPFLQEHDQLWNRVRVLERHIEIQDRRTQQLESELFEATQKKET